MYRIICQSRSVQPLNWEMRGIGAFDFKLKIEQELKEKYGEEQGGIKVPLAKWQALAMLNDIKMIDKLPDWKR
jgi:hypothetical protein